MTSKRFFVCGCALVLWLLVLITMGPTASYAGQTEEDSDTELDSDYLDGISEEDEELPEPEESEEETGTIDLSGLDGIDTSTLPPKVAEIIEKMLELVEQLIGSLPAEAATQSVDYSTATSSSSSVSQAGIPSGQGFYLPTSGTGIEVSKDPHAPLGERRTVTFPNGQTFTSSPIVLDLNRNSRPDLYDTDWRADRHFVPRNVVAFDIDCDGELEVCEWMKPGQDALLVYDADADGWIRNQAELFGNSAEYQSGYERLAALFDHDGNGVLAGDELSKLGVWIDDGDAQSESGELFTCEDLGITHIDVRHDELQSTFTADGEDWDTWDWFTEYVE